MFDTFWAWCTPWWSDWAAFVRMGRHGVYVWASVAVTVLVLALEWWVLRRSPSGEGL